MDVLHTAVEVTDLDGVRGFYEDLLGLEKTREFEVGGYHNYCVGGAGPAEIQFRIVGEKPNPAGIHHIAIATDDVDAVVEEAVSTWESEVEIEPQTVEEEGVRLAFVTDPEGYSVELIEELHD